MREDLLSNLYKKAEELMKKTISVLEENLRGIRAGRVSTALVEKIQVNYYDTVLNLNQLSTLSIPDTKTIAITLWDKNAAGPVIKALQKANLGINPILEQDNLIKLYFPPLSQERRNDLIKIVEQRAEEARISIRNIRRNINSQIKELERDSKLSKDDSFSGQNKVQKITDSYIEKVEKLVERKKEEILET
jgi:ribosome recycling factor